MTFCRRLTYIYTNPINTTYHILLKSHPITFTLVLSELVGLEALNGQEFVVSVKDPYSFTIDVDTTGMGRYVKGGYANQIKKPVAFNFQPLSQSIVAPGKSDFFHAILIQY